MGSDGTLLRTTIVPKPSKYSQDAAVDGNKNSGNETLQPSNRRQQPSGYRSKNVVRNSLIAGSISGMASTLVMYPMDLIRTTIQAGSMASAGGSGMSTHGGPLQVFRQIVQVGGIRALYTGIALPLAAQAAYKGTVFTINNTMERAILDYKSKNNTQDSVVGLTMTDRMFCGYVAGAINGGIFVTPVEFVRNQLIAQQAKLASNSSGGTSPSGTVGTSWSVIRNTIRTDGILSLWRGFGITTVRDGVGVAFFFSAMAITQQFLMSTFTDETERKQQQPPFWIRLVSGASAGLGYWVSSLPMDTVKTWIQSSESSVRVSPLKEIGAIYANYGALGVVSRLNSGWQVAYGRGTPAAAITIGVYSSVYHQLQQYDEKTIDA